MKAPAVWLLLVAATSACATAAPAPLHGWRVPAPVGRLLVDDAAFAEFARAVRADVERELARAARDPRATQATQATKDRWFVLALLDALDDRFADSVAALDRLAALEDTPNAKAMNGLTIRVWADARAVGGDTPDAFRAALQRRLSTMPLERVRDGLSMLRTMGRVFTPDVCRQLVDEEVGPRVKNGLVDLDQVHAVLFQRWAVKRLVPVGKAIDEVLAAHGIELRQ
jgi:hypothetical protein